MLIAITADIHDNLANLEKFLTWCQQKKINNIFVCGDITNEETIKNLAQFPGKIFIVKGNSDLFTAKDIIPYKNINYYGSQAIISLAGLNMALVHESKKIPPLLKIPKLNYIFYGHSHKPWLEEQRGINIVNPGNLANIYYRASFSTLDTKTKRLELKILSEL